MKKKLKLRMWVKVVLCFILGFVLCGIVLGMFHTHKQDKHIEVDKSIKECKKAFKKEINNTLQEIEDNNQEEIEEEKEEYVEETYVEPQNTYTTRMTSFYPAESSDCTGSGLCSWDFGVNEHGWYTYNGKLVVATATEYLLKYGFTLNEGVHTYRYYDEITLVIDGIEYQAIVLDSCGSSMRTDRIDLFVRDAGSVKDTIVEVIK